MVLLLENIVPCPLTVFVNFASDKPKLRVFFFFFSYSLPFWVKEKANKLKNEIREVEELNNWRPAVPLIHSLFPAGGLKNLQKIA